MRWEPPPELVATLHDVARAAQSGRISEDQLSRALDHLGQLDTERAPAMDNYVPYLANLPPVPPLKARRWFFEPEPVTPAMLLAEHPRLAWLFLFHRNGFVRQGALERLPGGASSPFWLFAVIWRMNDWVPQVRSAARAAFRTMIVATPSDVIARSMPSILERSGSWLRWEEGAALLLDTLFERAEVVEGLVAQFRNHATGPAAKLFKLALRHPVLDPYLPDLERHAIQPSVRAIALQTLIDRRARWPVGFRKEWIDKSLGLNRRVKAFADRSVQTQTNRGDLIRRGLSDRSAVVRRVAADALINARHDFPDLASLVEVLAQDKSPSIRERAGWLRLHLDDPAPGGA